MLFCELKKPRQLLFSVYLEISKHVLEKASKGLAVYFSKAKKCGVGCGEDLNL